MTNGTLKILVLSVICLLSACAAGTAYNTDTEEPGWYGITTGWNNWVEDIDGKVGHRLYVSGPRGKCLPSHNWTAHTEVVSGSLPPGMNIENVVDISGIPTQRGHWIVSLRLSNIECGGLYYKDFDQELRFHISGTGSVNY